MGHGVSHLDLMASVTVIGDVARAEDVDGLHLALCRLRNELAEHIALESDAIDGMSGAVAEPVRQGQRRLLKFVDDMLTEASDDAGSRASSGPPNCEASWSVRSASRAPWGPITTTSRNETASRCNWPWRSGSCCSSAATKAPVGQVLHAARWCSS